MAGWNYRIFREKIGDEINYSMREAYYDDKGNVDGYTSSPIIQGESLTELEDTLKRMLNDIERFGREKGIIDIE